MLPIRALMSLALAFLVGCSDDDDAPSPGPSLNAASTAIPAEGLSERIVADLATRLGVPVSDIHHVESCEFTWPDGSLGVAESGMVYTQALVPGWLVILEAGGEEYRYHGAANNFIAADFVANATVLDARCP